MNCRQIRGRFVEHVLGELTDSESQQVREHLAACPGCQTELREVHLEVELLHDGIAKFDFDAEELNKIKSRSISRDSTGLDLGVQTCQRTNARFAPLLYLAAFAAGVLLMLIAIPQPDSQEPIANRPPVKPSQGDAGHFMELVTLTTLRVEGTNQRIAAQILYDRMNGELHFFGRNMPKLGEGTGYVLAMIHDDRTLEVLMKLEIDRLGHSKAVLGVDSVESARRVVVAAIPVASVGISSPGSQ